MTFFDNLRINVHNVHKSKQIFVNHYFRDFCVSIITTQSFLWGKYFISSIYWSTGHSIIGVERTVFFRVKFTLQNISEECYWEL